MVYYRKTVTKDIATVETSISSCSANFVSKLLIGFNSQNHRVQQTGTNLMCNINHPKFSCRICVKNVSDKDKAVQCNVCELWVHIKFNNLNNLG